MAERSGAALVLVGCDLALRKPESATITTRAQQVHSTSEKRVWPTLVLVPVDLSARVADAHGRPVIHLLMFPYPITDRRIGSLCAGFLPPPGPSGLGTVHHGTRDRAAPRRRERHRKDRAGLELTDDDGGQKSRRPLSRSRASGRVS